MLTKSLMLATFFLITFFVGWYYRSHASSVSGFVLAGRSIGPWLTAFAYGTSYFSAVVFVGYAGQFGWRFGISSLWIGLGNAFIGSLLAWAVLARRTRIITRSLNSATMPDFFGKRYESNGIKIFSSAITFVFLVPYAASLFNGLSRLFAMAFNISFVWCIAGMALLTAAYVILGGLMATAVNDFIQGVIMLMGIVAAIGAVLGLNGGFAGSLAALASVSDPEVSAVPGIFASIFGPNPLELLGVVILTSLGTWGLPQMVGKFYSIKSEKNISAGTIISTFFALIVAGGCYFLGGFGRLFGDKVDVKASGYDAIIPAMLSSFGDALIGIVIVLVLAASISTLSSLVLTSASTFTLDFLKGSVSKKMTEKGQLRTIRFLVAFFILASSALAVIQYSGGFAFIAQLMGVSWGAMAGAFLAPFLYGLYWKKATKAAVWINMAFAVGFMIYNILFRTTLPAILQSPINAGAFAMLFGMLLVPAASFATPKMPKKNVEKIFSCYEAPTSSKAFESLGSGESGKKRKS
jgi:Na+/proline symporter